jgi:hypothetical protein
MTTEQQLSYWKHFARKNEQAARDVRNGLSPEEFAAKRYDGLTPDQVRDMRTRLENLETEKLPPDEKALKASRSEAYKQAMAEAEAKYLPQIRAAKVQSIASGIVSGERLSAFMDVVDTSKLLGDDGQVSEEKVMGYLTAMYAEAPNAGPRQPQWQNFGQFTPPPPAAKPGSGGEAEAKKRFGAKTT